MNWQDRIFEHVLDPAKNKKPVKKIRGSVRDTLSPKMKKVWDAAQKRKKNK